MPLAASRPPKPCSGCWGPPSAGTARLFRHVPGLGPTAPQRLPAPLCLSLPLQALRALPSPPSTVHRTRVLTHDRPYKVPHGRLSCGRLLRPSTPSSSCLALPSLVLRNPPHLRSPSKPGSSSSSQRWLRRHPNPPPPVAASPAASWARGGVLYHPPPWPTFLRAGPVPGPPPSHDGPGAERPQPRLDEAYCCCVSARTGDRNVGTGFPRLRRQETNQQRPLSPCPSHRHSVK